MQNISKSKKFFFEAQKSLPGGVNSPVRAFKSVGGTPRFLSKALGAYLYDVDDNEYVDTICSWGPAIVGHAHPDVISAINKASSNGLSFGAPTTGETHLAELIRSFLPSIEMVRLTSSGTEATMSAIRLARGATNRTKIVKFEGCYHGHVDSLLVKAGSGLLTTGNPTSAGIPKSFSEETLVLPFNDELALTKCFQEHGKSIAGVIIEPYAGNMNLVKPKPNFLEKLRQECDAASSVLIFDEVMTGFRVGLNGAQGILGVKPDITTLGKVIGGGMPMGAFGGKREIMEHIAPLGNVYHAGTLSGNPIAVAAGIATLNILSKKGFFATISNITNEFAKGFMSAAKSANYSNFSADSIGGMFGLYFRKKIPNSFDEINECNQKSFNIFFHLMPILISAIETL
jgi:glutamate-1-semialdehyde 2,1-aminomutase